MFNHRPIHQSPNYGFTLVEVLVITSLTVILLLGSMTIFMTFMLNQSRLMSKQRIQKAGDDALAQMTRVLREARSITGCATNMSTLPFVDLLEKSGSYTVTGGQIASTAADNTVYILTSDNLTASAFTANCYPGVESDYLKISFTISDDNNLRGQSLTQDFSTGISLRN